MTRANLIAALVLGFGLESAFAQPSPSFVHAPNAEILAGVKGAFQRFLNARREPIDLFVLEVNLTNSAVGLFVTPQADEMQRSTCFVNRWTEALARATRPAGESPIVAAISAGGVSLPTVSRGAFWTGPPPKLQFESSRAFEFGLGALVYRSSGTPRAQIQVGASFKDIDQALRRSGAPTSAVTGSPVLMRGRQTISRCPPEYTHGHLLCATPMARTGVGVSADGNTVYFVAASPAPTTSPATTERGLTLTEFAQIFKSLRSLGGAGSRAGAIRDAIALASGGDAAFVWNGRLVTNPTGEFEHPVKNHLAITVSGSGPSASTEVPWGGTQAERDGAWRGDRDCSGADAALHWKWFRTESEVGR